MDSLAKSNASEKAAPRTGPSWLLVLGRIIGVAIAALLETAVCVMIVDPTRGRVSWPILLGTHWAACFLALLAYLPSLPGPFRREKWIALTLPMGFAAALPGIGPLLAWGLLRFVAFVKPPADEQTEYFFGDNPYLTDTAAPGPVGYNAARSLSELLQSPDVQVRRTAILAVRNLATRRALPLLRQAQQDSDEQVRIFARNCQARIVENLESSLKLTTGSKLDLKAQLDHVIHVVDQYQEFVDLGLLNEGGRKTYLDRALALLDQIRQNEPENEKVLCLLLKVSLLSGDRAQASMHLQRLQKLSQNPNITLPWELQLHFQDRDWPGIIRILDYFKSQCYNDPQFRAAYEFWRLRRASSATRQPPAGGQGL